MYDSIGAKIKMKEHNTYIIWGGQANRENRISVFLVEQQTWSSDD